MFIEEKYLIKKNKFNIDKNVIFNNNTNIIKIKNNKKLYFLFTPLKI